MTKKSPEFPKGFTPTPERAPVLLIWHRRLPNARLVRGFTLIELLVVFAVIGLLAGIILASVKSVRDRASIAKTLAYSKSLDNLLAADAAGIWNFDDQTNPTKDTSGWANHGTINGATFTTDTPHKSAGAGAGKYALSFDGGDDYVSVPDNVSLRVTTDFTFEAWVKPLDTEPNYIFAKDNIGSDITGGYNFVVSSSIMLEINNVTAINSASNIISANIWQHVVVTHAGTGYAFYLNGLLINTLTNYNNPTAFSSTLLIGRRGFDNTQNMNGLIDEVRVFSRALSQAEIQKLYAEGLENHSNFVSK